MNKLKQYYINVTENNKSLMDKTLFMVFQAKIKRIVAP